MERDYYTPEQLAEKLQISVDTLTYWRKTGKGPRHFMAGRHPRYRNAAVLAWVREQEELQAKSA